MMDPQLLIDSTTTPSLPAPFWFVQFFKCLGFTLHIVPMNLWFAGLLIALWLHLRGNPHARHFAARLLQQMPIIVACGVNLGIVPLLFIQLAYYKVFYTATILMAWFWLGIIVLLIPAYYGVYIYAWGIRNGSKKLASWQIAAGWCAAIFFLMISFLFANGLSLMDHVERWGELWKHNNLAGAALGTALNIGDATLWPRWLLMFGLALGTTAVWCVVDAEWLTLKTVDAEYRRWAWNFAGKLYTLGMFWAAAAGTWYLFTWSGGLFETMFDGPVLILTLLTGAAPGLPWLLILVAGRWLTEKRLAAVAIALGQLGVLGINAISRQIVQNVNLAQFWDVSKQPVDVQWSPLVMFLVVFVLGLVVLGWMIAQVMQCAAKNNSVPGK